MSTKIRGRTVMTPMPRSDWNQADPKKADYIKNKPTEMEVVRGYSAYQVAVLNGFDGTEEEWLRSLHGSGSPGRTPVKGVDYFTEADQKAIVEEVLKQMPEMPDMSDADSQLAGKWVLNKVSNGSPGEYIQEINFTSTVGLYQMNDGSLGTIGNKDQLVSTHEVQCSKMELLFNEAMPMIVYTVESTDETLQAFIDQNGSNRLMVFSMFLVSTMWSHSNSKTVDFGKAQKVSAEFKEVFEVIATERTEGVLTKIDFTNFENGSFTEVVDGETVTHSVTFDDSGRPSTIDGVAIVWG